MQGKWICRVAKQLSKATYKGSSFHSTSRRQKQKAERQQKTLSLFQSRAIPDLHSGALSSANTSKYIKPQSSSPPQHIYTTDHPQWYVSSPPTPPIAIASPISTSPYKNYKLRSSAASPRPPHSRARPAHSGRAQERRDAERTPGYVRYVDELDAQGSCADESGMLVLNLKFITGKCVAERH
jgi:hypothetical protein